MQDAVVVKWLEGKSPKKIIYVKNKMINVVVQFFRCNFEFMNPHLDPTSSSSASGDAEFEN